MKVHLKPLLGAGAVAVAMFAALPAQAGPYAGIVILGDSLSDSGNNFLALAPNITPNAAITSNSFIPAYTYAPAAPYPFGVYSNGPVWASYAAAALGVSAAPSLAGGSNLAFGGAETSYEDPATGGFPPSLVTQKNLFLASTSGVAPSDYLYVVAGGGNNARHALADIAGGANLFGTIGATSYQYATDIGHIVDSLQGAGATDIVVWNTPNLGTAPAVLAQGAAAAALATGVAEAMNGALNTRLSGEVGVTTFDLFGLVAGVIADPAAHGLSNVVDACVGGLCNASSYLFWDGIHPTAKGHRLIASAFVAAVVPEPQTWLLLALGLAAVALSVRQRQFV